MHVHVGFGHKENPEFRGLMIEVMNQARYFIPHLLALSASSPFWQGQYTGLSSYRSVVFEQLPRTGIPHSFQSWSEYEDYVKLLKNAGSFGKGDTMAKIWWDIRPHPLFDTLEFRIADVCTTVDEAVCIAALFQAICAKLVKLRQQNMGWRQYRHIHITENKWRAVRYGIHGRLIDFGRGEEVPFHFLMEELLELLDDVVDELGSRKEVEYVRTILANGNSADRQLKTYRANGGDENRTEALHAVVDNLILETRKGVFE
jgi:carboxylate-amine ligase